MTYNGNFKSISDQKVAEIVALHAVGLSKRSIASNVGVSESTVRKYVESTKNKAKYKGNPMRVFKDRIKHLEGVEVR